MERGVYDKRHCFVDAAFSFKISVGDVMSPTKARAIEKPIASYTSA